MAIRKPSEYFDREKASVENVIQGSIENPELNTFSDAYEAFKRNLSKVDILSDFSETLENYQSNIEKVNHLSEKIDEIDNDVKNLLTKDDLDKALVSQLLFLEECIREVQDKVNGINQKSLTKIKLDVSGLSETVNTFVDDELPKYEKLVVDSELRLTNRCEVLEDELKETLDNIKDVIDEKYIEDFNSLNEELGRIKNNDIPKYKNLIIDSEIKTDSKIKEFAEFLDNTVNDVVSKIELVKEDNTEIFDTLNSKVGEVNQIHDLMLEDIEKSETTRDELDKKIVDLKVEILRNESHIEGQNKSIETIHEDVKSAIDKLNIEEIQKNNSRLASKIKYIEEVFEKFNEQELLSENIITEPSSSGNSDPLTPLDQKFVTLDQLQSHYRLFVNRIQQQLSSLGGGGEVRLEFLDDVDRDSAKVNNKFLKYDSASGKWVGADASGGAGSQTLDETLGLGNTSSRGMSVGVVTSTKLHVDSVGSGVTFSENLVVVGDARVTGILSIGTSSIVLDPNAKAISGIEEVQLGETTLKHDAQGNITFVNTINPTEIINVGIGTSASVNTIGIITAASFSGSGANLTNIPNTSLDNTSVSFGGVTLNLGGSDATPAFDLSDATNYPTSSLSGTITNAQLAGSIADGKLASTFLKNVVEDTTPQLGGNLDLNSNNITGTGNINLTGVITATSASFSGNVSIAGTLTYDDVTNVDSIGLITARSGIEITSGDLTIPDAIIHSGDTNTKIRFPANDTVAVETNGSERLRIESDGKVGIGTDSPTAKLDVDGNARVTGVVTATTFSGNLPTTDLTGTITNSQLAGSIANAKLANDSVSFGGVSVDLGASDATPAFDLSDATNYPTSSLSGTITNAQLAGSIANAKLANSNIAIGGITFNLGDTDATPAFDLSDATNYPTSSLSGTITNAQLAGSIANAKLVNDSVSFGGVSLDLGQSDATPAFDLSDATNYPTSSLTGTITNAQLAGSIADGKLASTFLKNVVEDTTPQLGGNLDVNSKDITGTGNVNLTGIVTATSFIGDGSGLTGVTASGSGVGIEDGGSTVGTAGTINFGNNLSVSAVSAGVVTITASSGATDKIEEGNTSAEVIDTGSDGLFKVVTEGSERLRILGIGSIGFGIANPTTQFHMSGGDLTVGNSGIPGTYINLIGAGAQTFGIRFGGNPVTDSAAESKGSILCSTFDSDMRFRLGGVEKLRLKSSGNFGIGTNNPTSKLHVDGDVRVTGVSTFQNNVHLLDDDKLLLGGSSGTHDGLEIYHDGSHSYIDDSGTGNLYLRSGTLSIQNLAGNKTSAVFNSGGGQELYHNNSKKFETTGIGVSIINGTSDTATISAPANLIIDPAVVGDNTGIVRIKGDLFVDGTQTTVNSTTVEIADKVIGIATTCTSDLLTDGAGIGIGTDKTFLYEHNSGTNPSLKSSENLNVPTGKGYQVNQVEVLNATTLGSSVVNSSLTSVGTLGSLTVSGDVSIADKIVHTGDTNTAIRFPAADTFTVETAGSERLRITSAGLVGIGTDNPSVMNHIFGSSSLYTRFEQLDGKQVNFGMSNGDGIISVSGANPLRVLVNGSESLRITSDGKFGFGTGGNIDERGHIESSGTTRLKMQTNSTGVAGFVLQTSAKRFDVQLQNDFLQVYDNTGGAERLRLTSTGDVGIGTNNPTAKLDVNGTLNVSGITTFQSGVHLGDDDKINLGDGNDLKIWHNGSNSIINDEGTGDLYLGGNANVNITNSALNEFKAKFITDGAVELYHDNSKKFETTDSGVIATGIVTATTFSGNLPTTDLTGTITNAQLAGSIANAKLSNSSIAIGGITFNLGDTDATPAFDLSDATNYPTSSLSGTITNSQLAGSIANAKLANDSVSFGGVSVDLGASDATPAFDLSDATNYPTSSLSGTITNSQLAGSIANAKLANSSIAIGGITFNLGDTDATPAFDLSDATNYPTSSLSGTITNSQLAGSIANSKLANDSVSFGGVSVDLGASDATPAFDLSDATNYPTSSLSGTITNSQLAGSIANSKLANDSVSFGGVSVDLGASDATPAFDLSDATNYPTSSLSGTITNAQLAGSIANAKLANSSIAIGGITFNLGDTDATPAFDLSDATNYPTSSLSGTITNAQLAGSIADGKLASTFLKNVVEDTTPQLGGNLDVNSKDITGTGNVNLTGIVTATSFSGSAANLTATTGASAATYGDGSNVAQIVVDANGRITGITNVSISGGGGGGATDKIEEGNTSAEVIDTGSDGRFVVKTEGSERLRIDSIGNVGIGTDSTDSKLEINVGTALTAFDIRGSEGHLFSVTNNLSSGSIFSVNDISGIPSIDVDADGTIQLAPVGATEKVGIGITNPTSKLHVAGDVKVTGIVTANSFVGDGSGLTNLPGGGGGGGISNYVKYVGTGTPDVNSSTSYTEVSWIDTTPQFSNGTWSATSEHVVVPNNGIYLVQVNFYITASITRGNIGLRFAVNDSVQSEIAAHDYNRNSSGHNESSANMSTILSLSANDQVSIYTARLASSGTMSLQGTNSTLAITQLA